MIWDACIPGPSLVALAAPQIHEAPPEVIQFARPKETERNDDEGEGKRDGPEDPLVDMHVADVISVHAQDPGDGAEGQKDNGYDGECVDGGFLSVFVGVDLLDVLIGRYASVKRSKG